MTSKGGRGESSHSHGKQQQEQQQKQQNTSRLMASTSQTEPLFPRVHVSETSKGPKAPPRNKMALYEQFTIPSQHFLARQASGSVWPPMNPAYASQYSPYVGNYFVPCYMNSSAAATVGEATGGDPSLLPNSMVMDHEIEKEQLQRVPGVLLGNFVQESEKVSNVVDNPNKNGSSGKTNSNNKNEKNNNLNMSTNSKEVHKRVRHEEDFAVPTYGSLRENAGKTKATKRHDPCNRSPDLTSQGERKHRKNVVTEVNMQYFPRQHIQSSKGEGSALKSQNTAEQMCSSNICESDNDNDFLHQLHEEEQPSGGSNASIVDSVGKIAPKDVIGAMGEQEFWKTRKSLLRQQRIFATQVFELHRVVKVQHLLAEAPELLSESNAPLLEAAETNSKGIPQPLQIEAQQSEPAGKQQSNIGALPHKLDPNNIQEQEAAALPASPTISAAPRQQELNQERATNNPPISTSPPRNCVPYPVAPSVFSGGANSWGYETAYPGSSQWTVMPNSGAFPPPGYIFPSNPAAPIYTTAAGYQPMFGASGYEIYHPMISRPRQGEINVPLYWQQPIYQAAPLPAGVHSPPWYTFPSHQFSQSQTSRMQKPANSTVMSPTLDPPSHACQQQNKQQSQQEQQKSPPSMKNSNISSIAQQSCDQQFQQQEWYGDGNLVFKTARGSVSTGGGGAEGTMRSNLGSQFQQHTHQQQQLQNSYHNNSDRAVSQEGSFKVVPRAVMATPESAAGILKSIQRGRK